MILFIDLNTKKFVNQHQVSHSVFHSIETLGWSPVTFICSQSWSLTGRVTKKLVWRPTSSNFPQAGSRCYYSHFWFSNFTKALGVISLSSGPCCSDQLGSKSSSSRDTSVSVASGWGSAMDPGMRSRPAYSEENWYSVVAKIFLITRKHREKMKNPPSMCTLSNLLALLVLDPHMPSQHSLPFVHQWRCGRLSYANLRGLERNLLFLWVIRVKLLWQVKSGGERYETLWLKRARNRLLQLLLPISALLANSWAAFPGMVERDPALPSWCSWCSCLKGYCNTTEDMEVRWRTLAPQVHYISRMAWCLLGITLLGKGPLKGPLLKCMRSWKVPEKAVSPVWQRQVTKAFAFLLRTSNPVTSCTCFDRHLKGIHGAYYSERNIYIRANRWRCYLG